MSEQDKILLIEHILNENRTSISELRKKIEDHASEDIVLHRNVDNIYVDHEKQFEKKTHEINKKLHIYNNKINLRLIELGNRMTAIEQAYIDEKAEREKYRREQASNRKWFVGLIVSIILAILGMVFSIFFKN